MSDAVLDMYRKMAAVDLSEVERHYDAGVEIELQRLGTSVTAPRKVYCDDDPSLEARYSRMSDDDLKLHIDAAEAVLDEVAVMDPVGASTCDSCCLDDCRAGACDDSDLTKAIDEVEEAAFGGLGDFDTITITAKAAGALAEAASEYEAIEALLGNEVADDVALPDEHVTDTVTRLIVEYKSNQRLTFWLSAAVLVEAAIIAVLAVLV